MVAPYPMAESSKRDAAAESEFSATMEIIGVTRRLRTEAGAQPGQRVDAVLVPVSGVVTKELLSYLGTLARAEAREATREATPQPAFSDVAAGVEVYLPLAGLADVEKESARLQNEIIGVEKDLSRVRGKLSNENFTSRAPAEVVEKERGILAELEGRLAAAQARLEMLRKVA
jgi:valyl-tRNA synthetase